jgi:hypothetical protein
MGRGKRNKMDNQAKEDVFYKKGEAGYSRASNASREEKRKKKKEKRSRATTYKSVCVVEE